MHNRNSITPFQVFMVLGFLCFWLTVIVLVIAALIRFVTQGAC